LGLEELLNTLRINEQKQIDDIWQQAKAEAESIRKQVADAITDITRAHEDQLASACQKSIRSILAESEKKAGMKKLYAYQDLDRVLHLTAIRQLPLLRQTLDYKTVFELLVNELPEVDWERIAVNPADVDLAVKFFRRDIVSPDESISGGLIAVNRDGRILVNNSFEKRLERKWPYILPEMIKYIEKRYVESGAAEKTE
jgi:V/A-type H+-transporting ATPase subunit E